jgi:CBS domain-containing protein
MDMLNRLFKKNIEDFKAKDLMTKAVITAVPQDNLLIVQNLMSRYRIKNIVIVENKNKRYPVGIVTIKDIIKFLISDQTDRELHEIPVDEAMTKSLITTNKNNSVVDCAGILHDHGSTISSLIVVEEDYWEQSELPLNKKTQLSGIITSTDFARFFSENCRGLASVKDYMSKSVFTISINEKVSRAAELMAEKNISRLVVIAANHHSDDLLGILTETDISRVTLAMKSKTLRTVYEYLQIVFSSSKRNNQDSFHEPSLIRIRDIFTPNLHVIYEDADLAEAAKIMIRQGIRGIPVIEPPSGGGKSKNRPVGIISKIDLIKALRDLK